MRNLLLVSLVGCARDPALLSSGSFVPEAPEEVPGLEGVNLNAPRGVASFVYEGEVYPRDLVPADEEDWPLRCGDEVKGGLPEELMFVDGDELPGPLAGDIAIGAHCRMETGVRLQWPGSDQDPITLVPFDPDL